MVFLSTFQGQSHPVAMSLEFAAGAVSPPLAPSPCGPRGLGVPRLRLLYLQGPVRADELILTGPHAGLSRC